MEIFRAAVADRVCVHRGARAHQPLVVEERAAECGVEEVVGQHVLRRLFRYRELVGRVIAQRQALGVAHRHELVHPAAVDLDLLLVVPVDEVPRLLVGPNIFGDVERLVRQARADQVRVGLRQARVGQTGREVDLCGRGVAGAADPVRAGKETVQVVEAMVLVVDHHQVVDAGECADVAVATGAVTRAGRDCRKHLARAHDGERADRKGQDSS